MTSDDIRRASSARLIDSACAEIDVADALADAFYAAVDGVRHGGDGLPEDSFIELLWQQSQRLDGAKAMVRELGERLREAEKGIAAEVGASSGDSDTEEPSHPFRVGDRHAV